jgi:hypothetical protein
MKEPVSRRGDLDTALVFALAGFASLLAFLFYLQRADVLLYGDAVAHINISRKVFDSQTPGLLQLGTVWLPLPHLLMLPFLLSNWMWKTGIGGSVPSMLAYVFLVSGVFRLVRGALPRQCGWQRTREWLRMDGSGNCRLESKSVVSAIHSDDGGFVSHVLSVDDCFCLQNSQELSAMKMAWVFRHVRN